MRTVAGAGLLLLVIACGSTPTARPGQYRVQAGDTLLKIARQHKQDVRDLARWNNLSDLDQIDVGQLLRVAPAGTQAPPTSTAKARTQSKTWSKTSDGAATSPAPRMALIWPASGKVTNHFNGSTSKGLTIADALGAPVVAAATGVVVYAGNGLRGYGNLLIVKHDANFLTIYAHNHALLVKNGQKVTQGQKIAEMGKSESAHVALYFELRYAGKATNPANSLPAR